ncbi:DUF2971 domain-containing protein [Serratia marcescens]|uniref:DUF2971 domain-containing protein n=1 Tax=Serratia marcescens TaxID=615 RepID=UPI000949A4F3|nr:DUF2971 domain-containing protein [Serratia marcescens]AVE51878.1 DUF2971 domain-containing protein [Serratia marcescens]MDU0859445.1 DUF2971 domain-containing protein [Serratia marcescens]HAX9713440.1 DUF2971 domain-containing protein [Serratia marcescens]
MLVKYYGLVFDEMTNCWSPRTEFISNGLFRMTQPKYLNDKGSEARLWPYFNKFSPADYAWAKREHDKIQRNPSYIPSNEELENFFLKPCGTRYGDTFPHMLHLEGFKSMDEYDLAQLTIIAEKINTFLVESISCHLGVLSLSKSDTNELMWTHYASEGKGLAVTFKENHHFFDQLPPKDVSYSQDKRASLTYYKGMMRMNGIPLKKFYAVDFINPIGVMETLIGNGIDIVDFSERLLYSKAERWSSEDEVRIVCPLMCCEKKVGPLVQPEFGFELTTEQSSHFKSYSEINLKSIPFDAFESIVLGYAMNESDRSTIIESVRKNANLSHLKLRVAKHDIYGNIEVTDLSEE